MRPKIFTFDGQAINDTTNFEAYFTASKNSFYRQADGPSSELKRADNTPVIGGIDMQSKTMEIAIIPRGTWATQIDTLGKWFNTYDPELKVLIVKDEADSDRQWYVMARPEGNPKSGMDEIVYTLKVPDPIWRTVSDNSESWNITASGDTNVFTILGNRPAKPVIKLKPTSTKSGGFSERMFRAWYNPLTTLGYDNLPLDVTSNAWDTTGLVEDASISNQINNGAGITAVATSIAIDVPVGGGLPTGGGVCTVDTEQIKYSGIAAGTMTVATSGRGWGGTTAAIHADNAVMKKAHMLANGADIKVFVDKRKVPCWISGANTSTTQVWIAADYDPGIEMELNQVIANTGAITNIAVKITQNGVNGLAALEKKNVYYVLIGSEIFTAASVDRMSFEITDASRAQFSSAMAAHAVGDKIYFMEHEIWICWGDLNAGSTLSVLETQDETHKPIIDIDNSTNVLWKYLLFWDDDGLRAGSWTRDVVAGRNCLIAGGPHMTLIDPATEMGLTGRSYSVGGVWRGGTYDLRTTLYHPAGFVAITCNGDKYRKSTGWPEIAGLFAGNTSALMGPLFNLATPASAASWTAWTETAVAIGNRRYVQFKLAGNILGTANNVHALEVQTITSITITAANVPQLAFSGAAIAAYEIGNTTLGIPARLKNSTTGDYIDISFIGVLNEELKIDCDTETVTYLKDNTRADIAITYPPRDYIFQMEPGTAGNNTLVWTDAGTAGITAALTWKDRNS